MTRSERQLSIIDIVKHNVIETQEQLVDKLRALGYKVTQATVSRDIKELKLVKNNVGDTYRYAVIEENSENEFTDSKMYSLFREVAISSEAVNNFVVVKTKSGMANTVAAIFDSIAVHEKLGTIAGDDTVLVIMRDNESAMLFSSKLLGML